MIELLKPKSDYKIRPTIVHDLAALKKVIDSTQLFPSAMLDDMMADYFGSDAPIDRWLTVMSDEPIGVAFYQPERMTSGTWNVLLMAVEPTHQRMGIGAALLSHIENDLVANGERIVLVETSGQPVFASQRAFYASCGYEHEATIRDFYDAGDHKVIFRKALSQRAVS